METPAAPPIPTMCLETQPAIWAMARRAFEDHQGFVLIRMPALADEVLSLSDRIGPAILLTSSEFLHRQSENEIRKLWMPGKLQVVVALGATNHDNPVDWYIREGCSGVLDLNSAPEVWRKAVRSVAAGEIWAPRRVVASILREMMHLASDSSRRLSRRESEILEMIAQGYNNGHIASQLFISKETVRWHIRSLYSKLGLSDRESAIRFWGLTQANKEHGYSDNT